ncbi:MAG: hypothetical protein HYY18_14810 [Planctomycetes bacterium]|nr:hypothetical protein [Planctomycetota bacterium]
MLSINRSSRRGFVLLVALGVLGVLGLLAATFATLSRVERAVSNSYVDKVRARLLAQSGIERALATLRGTAMQQAWDDPRDDWYYREMLNGPVGALSYTPGAIAAMGGYTPSRAYGAPPRTLEAAADAGLAGGPVTGISYADAANPATSGSLPGTYEIDGDLVFLKVLDCQGMLYVNDQNPEIKRLLTNLGSILGIDAGGFDLGVETVKAAKTRGKPFNNKSEVLDEVFVKVLGPDEGRKRFAAARNFITCHAWVDLNTMHFGTKPAVALGGDAGETRLAAADPAATTTAALELSPFAAAPLFNVSARLPGSYPTLPATRFLPVTTLPGVSMSPIDQGGGLVQFVTGSGSATVPAKFGGTNMWVQPRAPVNVNTATREVLVALLWGLKATFVDYDHATGKLVTRGVSITKAEAEVAADHILTSRFTFGSPAGAWSYNDWMHVKNEVLDTIPGLDRFKIALIHANCNPNTDIRKLNPDLLMIDSNPVRNSVDFVRLDKSDITVKSTELCFSSMGLFEIEALGRVYSSGRIMAEERIETVMKLYDVLRYTTQEQFERDRNWDNDDPKESEGSLMSNGYPPVVSMPEYPYNNPKLDPMRYKSATNNVTWAADYDGYLILNGSAKVTAGVTPADFNASASKMCRKPNVGQPATAPWTQVDWANSGEDCKISGVWGFNEGTLRPSQSHANSGTNPQSHLSPRPTNPEYEYDSPNCEGVLTRNYPANSLTSDDDYRSAGGFSPKQAFQVNPAGGLNTIRTGLFEGGADIQPFGLYVNYLKRRRFHTIWGDELPTGDFTVEFMYKPEVDHWEWAKGLPRTALAATWDAGPCGRMHLWGLGAATHGTNYEQWLYVQGPRVYYDLFQAGQHYIIYADHQWRAHTWHHIEISIAKSHLKTLADGSTVTVPHNAMLYVDGVPASGFLGSGVDVSTVVGKKVYDAKAMSLPTAFIAVMPNNDWGVGPRMEILSKLQKTPGFGMSQPSTMGTLDNLVIHHWRSHDASFTPRNRYHSTSYYNAASYKSGVGYLGEKAGVYKKRLKFLEDLVASGKDVTIGTVSCTHYHPFHEHLYGHDGTGGGGPKPTSFGHITPAIRMKSSGSYLDAYGYDGCAGLPVKARIAPGTELFYLAWFEVASLVPVNMSPILGDFTITYFTEPKTYYRLASAEAK